MNFLIPQLSDIIDIIAVALILYFVIFLMKKTGGYQVLIGFALIFLLYLIASFLNLQMMSSFLKVLKDYWIIAFVILFQKEIRSFFSSLAENYNLRSLLKDTKKSVYSNLLNAVSMMAFRKIGALIVLENKQKLDDLISKGEVIDARISIRLLLTIFNNRTILHDGAVIIRNKRIYAVKVILPLSENFEYTQMYGTRHLAAIGISEITDALTVVVSEETGTISVTKNGVIERDITIEEVSQKIKDETI